ncbi:hypothetical protein G5C66_15615 [Nocardioides sp. KC13]|uniref:Uncharacterized protein n=1 Tax=Nocardioides turkmenicus TaxID=2711220 RepID=A0A6M1R349_9ACTN|nr:hypothetical protein [Nocardioides sp. KC13]NGN94162.1 hypothetical protein [Nocardioides sp. KC13]
MPRRGQGAFAPAPDADTEPAPLPLEQVRRTPGASMAPQLSMTAPSGEQPAFGGGMAPPPAGSEGGGLFGLAARTPKFEPELASQSQSLFLPKRRKVAEQAEQAEQQAEQAPEEPTAPEPAPAERPEPEQPAFEAPAPEPEMRQQQVPESPEPMAAPPLPERPVGARGQSGEHAAFVEPAPLADRPQVGGPDPDATVEAMPPVERRQPEPARPDATQVAMSPRFDAAEDAPGGTRPRDELEQFEQFAPPPQQFDAPAPEARYDAQPDHRQPEHGQPEQSEQTAVYGDPAYAPLAPQLEPDQAQWSGPYDQPYDQGPGQAYEQSYGQPQDGSQDQFGQPYGDPYGQNVYADATLVGQPPVGPGPNTPAPPPMAPQGYDPYGNAYDARYEPQRGQGQGKGLGGLDLKRWGLIVLVVAVVVAIIAFIIGLNNNGDANAKTGTTKGATTTGGGAAAEAKKVDELIKTSAKDKAAIGAAQADLEACENIEEAIQTFQDAAASRKELATKVAKIDTAVLPGSRKLVKNLEAAWLTSQNADLAFAAWGEKRKVNAEGECVGGKRKLEKATTLSLASHDPKKAAAKAWGPIAEEYGLESVEWTKL